MAAGLLQPLMTEAPTLHPIRPPSARIAVLERWQPAEGAQGGGAVAYVSVLRNSGSWPLSHFEACSLSP